jgi:asparagine synthase (glutamine-hydrolysing)
MCRIAGIISPRLQPEEIINKVKTMCYTLQHGGPDDEGIFTDNEKHLVFGHRRLSIIDLSRNGHQPMADVHQKAWISFNGEIYNYRELKTELILSGASFHSGTDTEVIIQAYLYWGISAFEKLSGMFAFALYDKAKALTYLVRDSAGIKPLYYHIQDGQLSFSSEVKALKAAGIVNEVDANWKVRFLAFGHIPEPYTTLKNVFSLPKGNFLCWDNNKNTYNINAYCKHVKEPYITNADEAKSLIYDALKLSIDRQLIADAPIGVFLSGGIDSSLITLLANAEKKAQLKTISIFFNEKAYDESAYQNIVFNEIQGEKFTHLVKQQDFEEAFPQILNAMDMPTNDGINTWFISKYAQQDGLKAVLSGLGADELYGGYPSFNRIHYLKYLKKIPSALFSLALPFVPDQYKKIEFLSHDHPLADYLLLRGLFTPADIAKILDMDVQQVNNILFSDTIIPGSNHYDEEYAAWMETNLYMQNQLLRDTDVMSMSHGLEVRVPFLDEDFQRLTMRISPEIRFNKTQAKKLLVDSFKDTLPEKIWNRPKMGFSFPLQQWMQQLNVISDYNLYKGKTAQNVIKKFKDNKVHWSKSFALYQLTTHE